MSTVQAHPAVTVADAVPASAIAALLARHAIAHIQHHHVAVRTIAEAHAQVPQLTVDLLKTVVFAIAGTPRVVLVAVACDAEVDYRQLARALACSRRALRLLPPARVTAELGFEVGGVGPFPIAPTIEVLIDDTIAPEARVKVGGGCATVTIELRLAELLRLDGVRAAAVARPGPTMAAGA